MPDMTGLDRLRELADDMSVQSLWGVLLDGKEERWNARYGDGMTVNGMLRAIADQIEAERDERVTRRLEDREAAEWVREHGGLEHLKSSLSALELLAEGIEVDTGLAFYDGSPNERCVALRNEVKGRLMPLGIEWPRFEDGELVRIGDKFECWCGEEYVVVSVSFRGSCAVLNMSHAHTFVVGHDPETAHGKRVRRPAPKVLDADGVEIREKCDVWWICEGDERGVHAERLRVEAIGLNGLVECSPYNGGTWVYLEPSELYVNKPVLAADGKPLREGEMVYHVETGSVFTVLNVNFGAIEVPIAWSDGGKTKTGACAAASLTHERPDSWERWRKDFLLPPVDYCMDVIGMDGYRDMGLDDAFDVQARDMERRAKALTERGAR